MRLDYREEYCSYLPPAEVLRRIEASLVPTNAPLWRDDYQPPAGHFFQGSVEGNTFRILRLPTARIAVGRNAGPFPIWGRVCAAGTGSCISFQVRLVPGSLMLVLWQLGMVSAIVAGASAAVWYRTRSFPWFGLGVLLVFPLFWLAGMYLTLFQEAARSRPLLIELTELIPAALF